MEHFNTFPNKNDIWQPLWTLNEFWHLSIMSKGSALDHNIRIVTGFLQGELHRQRPPSLTSDTFLFYKQVWNITETWQKARKELQRWLLAGFQGVKSIKLMRKSVSTEAKYKEIRLLRITDMIDHVRNTTKTNIFRREA